MHLTRLKLAGFKTFVEPTELLIEPGLTGIVGPNGCGKSNLVEALRWVMGESSFKNMRGAGMDDVIFAGSTQRPPRNMAEVSLTLDNADRRAPAAFNEADVLEVTRRIEREEGSTYKVNGKEVRARDVQLLFADAATGARSPALVRQGQISEIIAAKPQSRRRILEDAAGIAGLYGRRHEAELRLKGAEENLTRLEDVLGQINGQVEALQKQARQATRYRGLAADIRRAEATLALIAHAQARAQEADGAAALAEAERAVAEATRLQADAARAQAVAAHTVPALREADAAAAAALLRLRRALDECEAENRRIKARGEELARRLIELRADMERQQALATDADTSLARLADEDAALAAEADRASATASRDAESLAAAETALAEAEARHTEAQARVAETTARRDAAARALSESQFRARRLAEEQAQAAGALAALDAGTPSPAIVPLQVALGERDAALSHAETEAAEARRLLAAAREAESAARGPLAAAEREAQRLETEIRTLTKLLAPATSGRWAPVLDTIRVARGYETALTAALGDDLDAADDPTAPQHWRITEEIDTAPSLPAGVEAMAAHVEAPAALARRLAQIGLVDAAEGAALQARLLPGQRLVSREGALWRWDGFTSTADAPSPAARRLAERNRLGELQVAATAARAAADAVRTSLDAAATAVREAAQTEASALDKARQARMERDRAREALAAAERALAQTAARRAGLAAQRDRAEAMAKEAAEEVARGEALLAALPAASEADPALLNARATLAERRATVSDARAQAQSRAREAQIRTDRRRAVAADIAAWTQRHARSRRDSDEAIARIAAAESEKATLDAAPDSYLVERRRLLAEIEAAERARNTSSDALAQGEARLREADGAARAALEALAGTRERRAGAEARLDAARQRLAAIVRQIEDALDTAPAGLPKLAGLAADAAMPESEGVERRLAQLRSERERLGAVNLRADEELSGISTRRAELIAERDDLAEAITRLRQAIGALNREGRERLLAAFEVVDGHFRRLFSVLFGGGAAELTLVDSEDPLEAGLEILARPPGKKPQVMTLLSGGEQALTATALIFAIFLTNPSPICVLDEVDAPLDDANVERYCDLLDEMARATTTRFLLITHNPITMARMDRLFGVTMAERGVSQMVSVDLSLAEGLLATA